MTKRSGLFIFALSLLLLSASRLFAFKAESKAASDAHRFGLDRLSPASAAVPDSGSLKALSSLNALRGSHWALSFDARTGLPLALTGDRAAAYAGTPEEGAAAFLSDFKGVLKIDPSTLVLDRQSGGLGHRHFLYRQFYRGLPVEFSYVKVHMDSGRRVFAAHLQYAAPSGLSVTPAVSAQQAAQTVAKDAGASPTTSGALVIVPDPASGVLHLAWKFSAPGRGASWRYYVDAHSGAVLLRYNMFEEFTCPPGQTSGNVSGLVYDIDPSSAPAHVRPFAHERVFIQNGAPANSAVTDAAGNYCAPISGKMFTGLQGPYVNVENFQGASASYDSASGGNGVWKTISTSVSSPSPYPANSVLVSTIDITATAPGAVKVMPVFSSFNIGAVASGSSNEGFGFSTDDQVQVMDPFGNPAGAYVGSLGSHKAAAVPGSVVPLRLVSGPGTPAASSGYAVAISSYLVLSNPTVDVPAQDSLVWTTNYAFTPACQAPKLGDSCGSEINLFYHLNQMHDYFAADVDRSSSPAIPLVNAAGLAGPDLFNAFYDPSHDNLWFGDEYDSAVSDAFTADATVPHHEYVHFVVEKIWPIQNFGQAGTISEANADYFSASSLSDPCIGNYVNGGSCVRNLDDGGCPGPNCRVLSAANWSGEIHADSLFVSQALWDIRKQLISVESSIYQGNETYGQSCADNLEFQALQYFPESFRELYDAMSATATIAGIPSCAPIAASSVLAAINAAFQNHGLLALAAQANANQGFETALDVSATPTVKGTISSAADVNFYTFGAGPGAVSIAMTLPPSSDGPGFYAGYTMDLYDKNHKIVATASPPFDGVNDPGDGTCGISDCTSKESAATLKYSNLSAGQMFLEVHGGLTGLGSISAVSSTSPFTLAFSYPPASAVSGAIVSAIYDSETIGFSVAVASFSKQEFTFSYAQLRDQNQNVLPQTQTNAASTYLSLVSASSGGGQISGTVQIQPGFGARFPAAGSLYVEVFGYSVAGSTVSLGLTQPLNLTANPADASDITAWNNVFDPLRGQQATVKYSISTSGHLTIKLYTLSGVYVRTLADGDFPAGQGAVNWDGRNTAGTVVASGVYFVHAQGPGLSKTQKIVVVK